MTYHLLDHCNRHNSRELARTDLDARALGTLEWVPPHVLMWGPGDWRSPHSLGMQLLHGTRGHKISCGAVMDADEYDVREFGTATLSRNNYNVVRPFDEAHMIEAAAPHTPHDLHDDSEPDESALPLCYEVDGAGGKFAHFRDVGEAMPKRHTPPNHGHGARCLCFFYAPNWDLSLVDPEIQGRRRMTAMVLSSGQRVIVHSASTGLVSPQDCEWCAGTGRIICDDERAGRVSPSHADGGYAEWQRRTMESAVAVRSGARQIGRITNMRSVDGFVVGDIELEDGSVVVERLMRSPFSSSEIGDAEPATTERE